MMEVLHPYLKYILYLILILGFLWTNRIFIQDPILRRWIQSFVEENGQPSSKKASAIICTVGLILGWLIGIHYSENHIAPEYYFWGILGLITSLHGIKEVGKVMTTKYTGSNGNGNGNGHTAEVSEEEAKKKKAKQEVAPEVPPDI